jgi:secondary thiamine-phosphate synthase enzyme
MQIFQKTLAFKTAHQEPLELTSILAKELQASKLQNGLVSVFCAHTSCSLVLMENADPDAWRDLRHFFSKLVPENFPGFIHTLEGPDDMPSHIRMALTRSSESIPFQQGRLQLGTWQGLFLWEHRRAPHNRNIHLTLIGE